MVSLYIHIPFCVQRCPFCSFVISIGKEKYIDSYLKALELEAKKYKGSVLKTIYIGGGTPTHLAIAQLQKLVEIISQNFLYSSDAEFTVEANPDHFEEEKIVLLRKAGVNRLSLGVQSLNNNYLKFLGRTHDSRQAILAFKNLRQAGFGNISCDLMFSLPGQGIEEIEEDVRCLVALGGEHLSLYALTIEEGTKFFKQNMMLDDSSLRANQYVRVAALLEHFGFRQYEVSNFAKPGRESRHNGVYWQAGNYIGLGAGAHSHIDGRRFWNTANLQKYISNLSQGRSVLDGEEQLDCPKRLREAVLLGLRMTQGSDIPALKERFGCCLPAEQEERINQFVADGFLKKQGNFLKTTLQGRLLLDELCLRLI